MKTLIETYRMSIRDQKGLAWRKNKLLFSNEIVKSPVGKIITPYRYNYHLRGMNNRRERALERFWQNAF